MIKPIFDDRKIYTLKDLSNKWNVSEYDIEHYLLTGTLKKFTYLDLERIVTINELERIYRLLPILNAFAREHIKELLQGGRIRTKAEKEFWAECLISDRVSDVGSVRFVMERVGGDRLPGLSCPPAC